MKINPAIILVSPQMGENIGASARAMKNFGFNDLRIVNPRDGWPNEKAISTAVSAADILEKAKIYTTLNRSIEDLEYLYATTSSKRDINKSCLTSSNFLNEIQEIGNFGIIFGRENNGLSNEEISLANRIVTIPTNSAMPSLNIAQSVAIICYEISRNNIHFFSKKETLASKAKIEFFYTKLIQILDTKGFFSVEQKRKITNNNIINLFNKIDNLSESELNILHGIINILQSTK